MDPLPPSEGIDDALVLPEILAAVFRFLSPIDLLRIRGVRRQWKTIIEDTAEFRWRTWNQRGLFGVQNRSETWRTDVAVDSNDGDDETPSGFVPKNPPLFEVNPVVLRCLEITWGKCMKWLKERFAGDRDLAEETYRHIIGFQVFLAPRLMNLRRALAANPRGGWRVSRDILRPRPAHGTDIRIFSAHGDLGVTNVLSAEWSVPLSLPVFGVFCSNNGASKCMLGMFTSMTGALMLAYDAGAPGFRRDDFGKSERFFLVCISMGEYIESPTGQKPVVVTIYLKMFEPFDIDRVEVSVGSRRLDEVVAGQVAAVDLRCDEWTRKELAGVLEPEQPGFESSCSF
ncbi:hypothetical protein TWF718_003442 [Orbilia javanica]|uniref:F-box domain-containing protein n=1 Tax=Orbilia javanica TaxID=47235 RepID=A0AAN8RJ21_9PEZI